jgi:rhodanese-related sulfurtransferase
MSKAIPENVVRIGQFQLENLLRNRVGFTYLDLRDPTTRDSDFNGHRLLAGSHSVAPEKAAEYVRGLNLPNHAPIVLICENGSKSLGVALELEDNSFINVFIIEGGVKGLNWS